MNHLTLIVLYLAAIVAANLSLSHWGAEASIYNAFLFVGLDLTCRDKLSDLWQQHLRRNMAFLISAGSLLSYLFGLWLGSTFPGGPSVGRIALASGLAFGIAATADALVYQRLRNREFLERSNTSNVVGAAVDSLIFLPLAGFGWLWTVMFSQFAAKLAGGVVFSLILNQRQPTPGEEWLARNRERYPVWVKE